MTTTDTFTDLVNLLSLRELKLYAARAKRNGLNELAEFFETEIAERLEAMKARREA